MQNKMGMVAGALVEQDFMQESRPVLNAELTTEMPPVPIERLEPTSAVEDDEEEEVEVTSAIARRQVWPTVLAQPQGKNVRLAPRKSVVPQESDDADEFTSSCECREISLQKMKGQWSMALASKSLLEKLGRKVASLLPNSHNSQLSCSRVTMSTPKMSVVAQDARILWEFRTSGSPKLLRLSGSALSMDHKSVRIQMQDFSNHIFSIPMCVLKYSGDAEYEYMLAVNGNGPCTEAALLVRNPDVFFDEDNSELISYLKKRITNGEMESLDIVPFANDCS
ncbi:hypothetical protein Y032_0925g3066 [Ancylostoma ceylanicum]|uniref:Uncharacterized protein n=1 Tax=Ancylostoma ceylanicum TaxID=53326 RepID=A0A016W985_9BILA|nr:hypothetical protein Y032_0925g3066 [Ancylostoma ceylanicum]